MRVGPTPGKASAATTSRLMLSVGRMRKAAFSAFVIACVTTRLVADACPDVSGASVFVRTHPVGNFRNEPVETGTDTLRLWTDNTWNPAVLSRDYWHGPF